MDLKCPATDTSRAAGQADGPLEAVGDGAIMISTTSTGCWDLDLATGMLALCPQSRAMFGLEARSTCRLTEHEWSGRLHPDDLEAVRKALTASVVHRVPYAERFRTVRSDGTFGLVLGVGRPLGRDGTFARFAGWNFDVATTGEAAAEWVLAHPEALTTADCESSAVPGEQPRNVSPAVGPSNPLLERAQSILRVRGARKRLLGQGVTGEPAFDLLLCLYVRSDQKETSLASLARPAGIPYSSAVRWIRYLEDKGLVERIQSKSDRRAIRVQLTPSGRAALDQLFTVR